MRVQSANSMEVSPITERTACLFLIWGSSHIPNPPAGVASSSNAVDIPTSNLGNYQPVAEMLTVDEDKASISTWVWRTINVFGTAVAEPSETCMIELKVLTECHRNFTEGNVFIGKTSLHDHYSTNFYRTSQNDTTGHSPSIHGYKWDMHLYSTFKFIIRHQKNVRLQI